jgi:hypothetical protein
VVCFVTVKDLESAIREFIDMHNEHPRPFVWTEPLTKSSPALLAMRTAPSPLTHRDLTREPLGRETSVPSQKFAHKSERRWRGSRQRFWSIRRAGAMRW